MIPGQLYIRTFACVSFVCKTRTNLATQVPQGHCWIVGDNIKHSRDSRLFGPIPLALIRGKVVLRWTPWTSFDIMKDGLQDSTVDSDELD